MIVVIADDLTGAAELGGIGLRYGLDVEIDVSVNLNTKAELLVISPDTRSMPEEEAVAVITAVTKKVALLNPEIIYKKVDSVLRGHIIAEMKAQLQELHVTKALLVSANPMLGRTIVDSTYFLHGQPIHTTSFSNDPEFPISSSHVLDMLRLNRATASVRKNEEGIVTSGITIGEAVTSDNLKAWASLVDKHTLLAGAAEFFIAVLEANGYVANPATKKNETRVGKPALYVCGTMFSKSREAIKAIKEQGGPVSYMPAEIIAAAHPSSTLYERWSAEVISLISSHQKAIIAIDEQTTNNIEVTAKDLREKTAEGVYHVLQKMPVKELVVEGGATATAIIKKQGFKRFFPVNEFAQGVIRMNVEAKENLYLTMKPGSYHWPAHIWEF